MRLGDAGLLKNKIQSFDTRSMRYAYSLVIMLNEESDDYNYGTMIIKNLINYGYVYDDNNIDSILNDYRILDGTIEFHNAMLLPGNATIASCLLSIIENLSEEERMMLFYLVETGYPDVISDDELFESCISAGKTYTEIVSKYDYKEKYFKKIKVFLSHNMSGIPEDFIMSSRYTAKEKVIELLKEKRDELGTISENTVMFIDNYTHEDAPNNAGRLWHLGRSIQQLENADYVYFIENMCDSKGCEIEKKIVELYHIEVLNKEM